MVIFIEWADGGSDIVRNCGNIQESVKMVFRLWEKHRSNIYTMSLDYDSGIIVKTYVKGGAWIG